MLLAGLVRDGRILACHAHHDCVEQVVRRLQSADAPSTPTLPRGLMVTFWASLMCRECDRAYGQTAASRSSADAAVLAGGWLRPESQLWLGDSGSDSRSGGGSRADGGSGGARDRADPRDCEIESPRLSALHGGRAARGALYLVRQSAPALHGDGDEADAGSGYRHGAAAGDRAAALPDRSLAAAGADDPDGHCDGSRAESNEAAPLFGLFSPIGEAFERGRCTSVRRIALASGDACRVTLPVDEWLCVLLQGVVDVTVDGARPVRLDASGGRPQLLWLPALPPVAPGLPPMMVQALDGPPVRGMALLHRASGVELAREARATPVDWRAERVADYWRAASERHPRLRDGQPFVSPVDRLAHGDRPALFEPRALCERSSAFELIVADLPASPGPRRDGDLPLMRRDGWRELIIPLRGRVRYALATPEPHAAPGDGHRLSQLARGGRALDLGSLASVAMRPRGLPDVLVFDGTLLHGFAPAGRDGASLLRIRGPI